MTDVDFDWVDRLQAPPASGAELLDQIETFLARFVAYPSEAAKVAHVLWIVHAWLMDRWESTPRIAFLSPEPGSGKSRALEVTEPLVPRAVHAVNTTPAYLFRKVSDPDGAPTILYDEIDTVFGPKAKDNEDIRGMLNAGHRRGATAGRCVVRGKIVETEELPAYCAVALAGLNDLPDTIMTRSVVVRMRRRAPGEVVEPWRQRINGPQAAPLADHIMAWAANFPTIVDWPTLPAQITDRAADVWEPLVCIADVAGGAWPERARCSSVSLVSDSMAGAPSLGVLLLTDIRAIFSAVDTDKISTSDLLERLTEIEESPWSDLRGKPLDSRGLARRLSNYGISSKQVRTGSQTFKGYDQTDLVDAWSRYCTPLPLPHQGNETRETTKQDPPVVSDVSHLPSRTDDRPSCRECGQPLLIYIPGRDQCEKCRITSIERTSA